MGAHSLVTIANEPKWLAHQEHTCLQGAPSNVTVAGERCGQCVSSLVLSFERQSSCAPSAHVFKSTADQECWHPTIARDHKRTGVMKRTRCGASVARARDACNHAHSVSAHATELQQVPALAARAKAAVTQSIIALSEHSHQVCNHADSMAQKNAGISDRPIIVEMRGSGPQVQLAQGSHQRSSAGQRGTQSRCHGGTWCRIWRQHRWQRYHTDSLHNSLGTIWLLCSYKCLS